MDNVSNTSSDKHLVDCNTIRALIPAYALGIADPDEVQLVEAHLSDCPELAAEIHSYRQLEGDMLLGVPQVQPPVDLEARILAATTTPNPIEPDHIIPMPARPDPQRQRRLWLPVAAVLAIMLILSNLFWYREVTDLNTRLDSQIADTPVSTPDTLIFYNASSSRNRLDIAPDKTAPRGTLMWADGQQQQTWVGIFNASGLQALSADQVYQLWLVQEDADPLSAGIFQVSDDGDAMLIFQMTQPIGQFDIVAITLEPAGGSDLPTSDPVLSGEL